MLNLLSFMKQFYVISYNYNYNCSCRVFHEVFHQTFEFDVIIITSVIAQRSHLIDRLILNTEM